MHAGAPNRGGVGRTDGVDPDDAMDSVGTAGDDDDDDCCDCETSSSFCRRVREDTSSEGISNAYSGDASHGCLAGRPRCPLVDITT